jgi:hypothetical protein
MDQYEQHERRKKILNSSNPDIDQLCQLIDENTFGLKSISSSKFHSIPSYQIKAFRSSRLKRLNSSSITKSNLNENSSDRTFSTDISLSSSLLNRFRSLSTSNLPQSRRYSSSTITLYPQKSMTEEEINSSTTESQCHIVPSTNSCNVEELAAYLDHFLYLPKSLSGAAELMYT